MQKSSQMMKAVVLGAPGPVSNLQVREVPIPEPLEPDCYILTLLRQTYSQICCDLRY